MGLDLHKIHEYAVIPGTTQVRHVRTQPALRLCAGDGPPIFIQGGRLYGAGGDEIGEPPPWFAAELEKCHPDALREAGWVGPAAGRGPGTAMDVPEAAVGGRPSAVDLPACAICGERMTSPRLAAHVRWKHPKLAQATGG